MIDRLKPYPEYKESGAPWIGKVPAGWNLLRAKYIFREVDERSTTGKEELLSVSHITGVTPRSQKTITMFLAKSNVGHKLCRPNDLVINTMWAWMAALGVTQHLGIVSPAYGVYRPLPASKLLPRFADAVLRTPLYAAEYLRRSTGVNASRLRLYPEHFLRIPLICPPPDEQAAIVRFLNHANAKIDRAVQAKRKLIALLNEQKQAIIHRAVTRGLDPGAKLKPSGIPWLGDIPDHWQAARIKNVARLESGHTPSRKVAAYWRHCAIPWFTLSDVRQLRGDKVERVFQTKECVSELGIANSSARKLPKGTVILSRTASVGFSGILDCEMATSQDYACWLPSERFTSEFLLYVLRGMRPELHRLMYGSTHRTIYMPEIHNLQMPLPGIEEQNSIVNHIRSECAAVNRLSGKLERDVVLLREYRTTLTAGVVTGKLDTRDAVKALPTTTELTPAEDGADAPDDPEEADE